MRFSLLACTFLVVLRLALGWQIFYEGLWKWNTMSTAKPWTSAGYLKNSQGPLRPHFRSLVDDPDDLNWLDQELMLKRWENWRERFIAYYGLLEEKTDAEGRPTQTARLDELLDGPEAAIVRLSALPEGVPGFSGSLSHVSYYPKEQLLAVDGKKHLTPRERDTLLRLVTVKPNPTEAEKKKNDLAREYQTAVKALYQRSARLSYKERLAVLLRGDPKRVTQISQDEAATEGPRVLGDIDVYKEMLVRYQRDAEVATTDFQREHLTKKWGELQAKRAELVGPVRALEKELLEDARKLLTDEQTEKGTLKAVASEGRIEQIDAMTMWGLLILGGLLLFGLFSRLAALGAAAMIFSFYLALPPWPGVPEPPGPEHSLIVNKNLIEVIALLVLATIPTGRWFGLDAFCSAICARGCFLRRAKTGGKRPAGSAPKLQVPVLTPSGQKPGDAKDASLNAAASAIASAEASNPNASTYTMQQPAPPPGVAPQMKPPVVVPHNKPGGNPPQKPKR